MLLSRATRFDRAQVPNERDLRAKHPNEVRAGQLASDVQTPHGAFVPQHLTETWRVRLVHPTRLPIRGTSPSSEGSGGARAPPPPRRLESRNLPTAHRVLPRVVLQRPDQHPGQTSASGLAHNRSTGHQAPQGPQMLDQTVPADRVARFVGPARATTCRPYEKKWIRRHDDGAGHNHRQRFQLESSQVCRLSRLANPSRSRNRWISRDARRSRPV
jgi:hypothetical protein